MPCVTSILCGDLLLSQVAHLPGLPSTSPRSGNLARAQHTTYPAQLHTLPACSGHDADLISSRRPGPLFLPHILCKRRAAKAAGGHGTDSLYFALFTSEQ